MTTVVVMVILLFVSSLLAETRSSDAGLRGPPHVTNTIPATYRVKLGETIRLDCPIDSGPSLQMYYEWKKDGETITSAWDRFRVAPKKLRIKDVLADDSGLYKCKGTNGFGSKELSTRLIIEDENGNEVGERKRGNPGNFLEPDEILGIRRRPSFTQISAPPSGSSTFRQQLGTTLILKCHVDGHPVPTVAWVRLKDNFPMGTGDELEMTKVTGSDSGVYVCIVSNNYGQINASFIVEVIETGMEGPVIESLDASNVTATKGQVIHFRCLISSDTLPNVQWLREVGEDEVDSNGSLQMAGVRYKVLGSPLVEVFHNGTYASHLTLPMDEDRETVIVCLATNSGGFKYESTTVAYLDSTDLGLLPMVMLIAIPATLLVLAITVSMVCCCIRKSHQATTGQPSRTLGMVTTATTYATPRDATTNDYQSPSPFYSLRQPLPCGPGPYQGQGSIRFQQYFLSQDVTPVPFKATHASPAYASVPICDLPPARPPPLPSRPAQHQSLRSTDNTQGGLMTQPLLTQTGSSSDSRDSRHSGTTIPVIGTGPGDRDRHRHSNTDHWCIGSGESDAGGSSWDKRNNSRGHQIRV